VTSGLRGQRLVVGLYLIIVAFTGFAGYMTATIVDEIDPPRFLFLIEFPATPLGLAAFGALTIGLVLGVLLVAVTVVSDRFDDASPGSDQDRSDSSEESTSAGTPTDASTASNEVTTSSDESTTPTDE